jgi:hypothetical protein
MADVAVPPVVVTQTMRGGPRDAPIHQLLKAVRVPPVDLLLAREAGRLLGISGLTDAADAQVMSEALRSRPSVLMTSDLADMAQLAHGQRHIYIVTV